jgi:hypothetical protein
MDIPFRLCARVVVVSIALAAFAAPAWPQANEMPAPVLVPSPVIPSPNARDIYTDAEALMRDSEAVGWSISTPMVLGLDDNPRLAADPTSGYHIFTEAEKEKLVAENLPAIAKLHDGMQYAYLEPPARSFDAQFPYLAKARAMARLLSLAGQTRAAQGDWGGAMDAYIDDIRLGSDLPHGAVLIGLLVGVACESIGRRHINEVVDHLSLEHARADANRMAQIVADEVPASQTFQEEEWFAQAGLQKMFTDPQWRTTLADDEEMAGSVDTAALRAESPKTGFDNYTKYMDALIAYEKLPWPTQLSTAAPGLPTDAICQILLIPYQKAAYKQCATTALDRLLDVQLALHAYRLEHGSYPVGLADLAPEFIPSVPQDPFTAGKLLQYRVTADKYVLYSVGPDTVDDGGKPMYDSTHGNTPYSALWTPDQKGDIVAGVNY